MPHRLFAQYEQLKEHIASYRRVGVAFSGGVDSSLLLYAAGQALPRNDVFALHANSVLNDDPDRVESLYHEKYEPFVQLEILQLNPLEWLDFIGNDEQRCYHCKKKTYSAFFDFLAGRGITVLLDGTNLDDLGESRPGLAVLRELQVHSPLLEIGLRKKDVRFLAQALGLSNHAAPSNSCLATRLNNMREIDGKALTVVRSLEKDLQDMGFDGCRARPLGQGVIIELRQPHFMKILRKSSRIAVDGICGSHGFTKVYLDLKGRQ